ncbi:MAG: glycosyltransferase family A protein [Candidatus Helarchaeota archaeon]
MNHKRSQIVIVVIPVRNEEATISYTLESLMNQTYQPEEIVLVDGGSTDKTCLIINNYQKKHPSIKLIKLSEAFPGKARNIGIKNSSSEIIAFLDAGVFIQKTWLENLINPLLKDKHLDGTYGGWSAYCRSKFEKYFSMIYLTPRKKVNNEYIRYPSTMSFAIRRKILSTNLLFREDLRSGEDLIFFKKLPDDIRFAVSSNSEVLWRPPSSFSEALKKIFLYSVNDGLLKLKVGNYIKKTLMVCFFALLLYDTVFISYKFIFLVFFFFYVIQYHLARKNAKEFNENPFFLKNPFLFISIGIFNFIISLAGFYLGVTKKLLRKIFQINI